MQIRTPILIVLHLLAILGSAWSRGRSRVSRQQKHHFRRYVPRSPARHSQTWVRKSHRRSDRNRRRNPLCTDTAPKPHIFFIMADDMGWYDTGLNNDFINDPHTRELALKGVRFEDYYTHALCTPSRTALLSGRYAFNTGTQHFVMVGRGENCLNLGLKLLPEKLKEQGYTTKLVGKWNLGDCSPECFPTRRGFDSFSGFTGPTMTYFDHSPGGIFGRFKNESINLEGRGEHLSILHRRTTREMIMEHKDAKTPLFMQVSPYAPHCPYEVTDDMLNRHGGLDNTEQEQLRKKCLGLVTAFDDIVGEVIASAKEAGLYENSVFIFSSDNGAPSATAPIPAVGVTEFAGSNWPYRGSKGSLFEGGSKSPLVIHSPKLPRSFHNTRRHGLMHITDWYPTLLSLAGAQPHEYRSSDGKNQVKFLFCEQESKREEIVYNIATIKEIRPSLPHCSDGSFAIRDGRWKLLQGTWLDFSPTIRSDIDDTWTKPAEKPELDDITGDKCATVDENGNEFFACLFDLKNDPYEQRNLYSTHPNTVRLLQRKVKKYMRARKQANNSFPGDKNDPKFFSVNEEGIRLQRTGYCNPHLTSPLRTVDLQVCPVESSSNAFSLLLNS